MESKFIENLFCRFFGKFSSSYRKVVDTAIASYNLCIWNWLENVHLVFWTRFYPILTHFWLMFQFLHPLKTPENQRFSGVFRGYKMGALARNGWICFLFFSICSVFWIHYHLYGLHNTCIIFLFTWHVFFDFFSHFKICEHM